MKKWIPDAEILRREEEELVYVVFEVEGVDRLPSQDFSQESTFQAPWDLVYFRSGTFDRIECGDDGPGIPAYRCSFFLHLYQPDEPIKTPQGPLLYPTPPELAPAELVKAHPYRWPWA